MLKHIELCKNNKFCQVELPNYVIYADLETLLIPYNTCDNKYTIIKDLNKHVTCGYSINVVCNHTKQTKQTYYRGEDSLIKFCKELREIGKYYLILK